MFVGARQVQASQMEAEDLGQYQQLIELQKQIVEVAEPPLLKSRPKRSILVLASVLAAFLFSVLGVLIAEAYRDFKWQDITTEKGY